MSAVRDGSTHTSILLSCTEGLAGCRSRDQSGEGLDRAQVGDHVAAVDLLLAGGQRGLDERRAGLCRPAPRRAGRWLTTAVRRSSRARTAGQAPRGEREVSAAEPSVDSTDRATSGSKWALHAWPEVVVNPLLLATVRLARHRRPSTCPRRSRHHVNASRLAPAPRRPLNPGLSRGRSSNFTPS